MKRFLTFAFFAIGAIAHAQQLSPTEMVAQPRQHKFAVSGIGGGNLYETKSKTGSSSGQMSVDWNMFSADKSTRSGKDKTVTVGTIFR